MKTYADGIFKLASVENVNKTKSIPIQLLAAAIEHRLRSQKIFTYMKIYQAGGLSSSNTFVNPSDLKEYFINNFKIYLLDIETESLFFQKKDISISDLQNIISIWLFGYIIYISFSIKESLKYIYINILKKNDNNNILINNILLNNIFNTYISKYYLLSFTEQNLFITVTNYMNKISINRLTNCIDWLTYRNTFHYIGILNDICIISAQENIKKLNNNIYNKYNHTFIDEIYIKYSNYIYNDIILSIYFINILNDNNIYEKKEITRYLDPFLSGKIYINNIKYILSLINNNSETVINETDNNETVMNITNRTLINNNETVKRTTNRTLVTQSLNNNIYNDDFEYDELYGFRQLISSICDEYPTYDYILILLSDISVRSPLGGSFCENKYQTLDICDFVRYRDWKNCLKRLGVDYIYKRYEKNNIYIHENSTNYLRKMSKIRLKNDNIEDIISIKDFRIFLYIQYELIGDKYLPIGRWLYEIKDFEKKLYENCNGNVTVESLIDIFKPIKIEENIINNLIKSLFDIINIFYKNINYKNINNKNINYKIIINIFKWLMLRIPIETIMIGELRDIYDIVDEYKYEGIYIKDMKRIFIYIYKNITKEEINRWVSIKFANQEYINFSEFCNLLRNCWVSDLWQSREENMKYFLKILKNIDKSKTASINSPSELGHILGRYKIMLTNDQTRDLFSKYITGGSPGGGGSVNIYNFFNNIFNIHELCTDKVDIYIKFCKNKYNFNKIKYFLLNFMKLPENTYRINMKSTPIGDIIKRLPTDPTGLLINDRRFNIIYLPPPPSPSNDLYILLKCINIPKIDNIYINKKIYISIKSKSKIFGNIIIYNGWNIYDFIIKLSSDTLSFYPDIYGIDNYISNISLIEIYFEFIADVPVVVSNNYKCRNVEGSQIDPDDPQMMPVCFAWTSLSIESLKQITSKTKFNLSIKDSNNILTIQATPLNKFPKYLQNLDFLPEESTILLPVSTVSLFEYFRTNYLLKNKTVTSDDSISSTSSILKKIINNSFYYSKNYILFSKIANDERLLNLFLSLWGQERDAPREIAFDRICTQLWLVIENVDYKSGGVSTSSPEAGPFLPPPGGSFFRPFDTRELTFEPGNMALGGL
eukprot:GHVL01037240.1.p1 GENE.GHVL01037240.1~~GHVL01037240.1.p1  ORF type:complete len:1112 (-),score=415.93 GHVL01037240.1:1583-4918(-)